MPDPTAPTLVEPTQGEAWFCDQGPFWGTMNQLCLCAKCGKREFKRHDEPRHFGGIFTSRLHMLCDECFDTLPDEDPAAIRKLKESDNAG